MGRRLPVEGARKLNLGSGHDVRPAAEGWTNLDGYADVPGVLRHDLTRFPYPFADDTFDAVLASHVLEHLPVIFEDWHGTHRDVLFHLLEEIHRILKPGGRFYIVVPLGGTSMGLQHPQHYRQWRPEWFRLLSGRHEEFRGYHQAHFEVHRLRLNRSGYRARYFLRLGPSRLGVFEHVVIRFPRLTGWLLQPRQEIEGVLVAVKAAPPAPPAAAAHA